MHFKLDENADPRWRQPLEQTGHVWPARKAIRTREEPALGAVHRAVASHIIASTEHAEATSASAAMSFPQFSVREVRAEYGKRIFHALSRKLAAEFGEGFSEKNMRHMVRFVEVFPDEQIVSALRRQLGWTHFKEIIYLDDPLRREFYAEMCRIERWSTRTLQVRGTCRTPPARQERHSHRRLHDRAAFPQAASEKAA